MVGDFSTRAPWKRSACDRCRSQKLRCYRDPGRSAGACHRCMKSGTKCVTSMARPTGRPPSRRPSMAGPNAISTSPGAHHTSSSHSISRADINSVSLDCDLSLDSFLDSIGMQHTDPLLGSDLDAMHDMHDIDLFPQQQQTSQQQQQSTTIRGSSPGTVSVARQQRGSLGSSSHSTDTPYQFTGSSSSTLLLPEIAGPADLELPAGNSADRVEILLSQLHLEFCNLQACVRSVPWDVHDVLRLTISPESGSSQNGDVSDTHPLVQVTKVSQELEKLLERLRPAASAVDHTPLAMSYTSAPPPSPCLGTTQLLLALSCYIQIVSIYDSIFSAVFDYLSSGDPSSCLVPLPAPQQQQQQQKQQESPPILYLCGLPIQPNRKLYGTLLVHQIEHQLERIEMLVGLPERYRISSKSPGDDDKDLAGGLFAGQHCQSLINAVFQLGECHAGEHDTRCVRSLKLKMRQIKDL